VVERNTDVFHDHDAQIHAGSEPEFNALIAGVSTVLAMLGIGIAFLLTYKPGVVPGWIEQITTPIQTLFKRKYYFDELYEEVIVSRGFYRYFARLVDRLDTSGFDNVNVQFYRWTDRAGRALAKVQDGQVQTYGIVSVLGLILAILIFVVVQ
jgi:NADH-quinone oxidoreductase subunit L